MSLTPEEQAELDALEDELNPQRQPAAPLRAPGDLTNHTINVLTPEEEAELAALEQEFIPREFQSAGQVENKGLITQVGEAIDSYTGAPVRKAVGMFQDTNSLEQSANAFVDQFGKDPSLAPTGKEIAAKAGFSTENQMIPRNPMAVSDEQRAFNRQDVPTQSEVLSPAGIVGTGVDVAFDLTNLVPFAGVALKSGGKAAKSFLKGSAAATDAMTGTKFIKAGENAQATAQATAKATRDSKVQLSKLFKPDVAPDFNETKQILEANGVATDYVPEALEFGERSLISRLARNTAEGPLGGDALEKHYKFVQDVSKATENNIAKIGGGFVPSKQEAGRILRDGYDSGVDSFFKQMDITYNSILDMAPGIQLTDVSKTLIDKKMAGIEKSAKGLVKRGISATDRSQGKELLNAVAAYRNAGPSLKQQKEAMNMIGRVAFKATKSGAELPSDIRSLREMYFSLQKGFTESTRAQLGDEIADALIANNKAMSHHFTERGPLAKVLEGAKADEDVFQNLIMRGNSKQIEALKSILPKEIFDQLKAAYLDNLISRNPDNVVNFRTSRGIFNGKKDHLKNIYTEEELKAIDDVLKVGDKSGQAVLSSSGTGASNQFADIKGTLQNKIGGDVLADSMKRGARQRASLKPVQNTAPSGKPMSGLQRLKEKSPITKGQAVQGAKVNSINERNERLQKYKQMRGR